MVTCTICIQDNSLLLNPNKTAESSPYEKHSQHFLIINPFQCSKIHSYGYLLSCFQLKSLFNCTDGILLVEGESYSVRNSCNDLCFFWSCDDRPFQWWKRKDCRNYIDLYLFLVWSNSSDNFSLKLECSSNLEPTSSTRKLRNNHF